MEKNQQNDFRESVRRHIDKGKTHHEGTRADAGRKIQKILELVKKKRGSKNSRKDSELVGLIEDVHKEYQSLYELCGRLQDQGKSIYGSEAQSWSFSSLDSEYFSSEEVANSPRKKEISSHVKELRNAQPVERDLDIADLEREASILKNELASARQEREALDYEYKKALSKIQESENTLIELTTEADGRIKELSTLRQEHRVLGTKSSARTKELEAQLTSLKVELDSLYCQKRDLEAQLKSQATEIRQLKEKNKGLQSHVVELELISKDRANQISSLMKKIKDIEKETSSAASELNAQVRNLQYELKTAYAQKSEWEERTERLRNDLVDKDKDYSHELEVLRKELSDAASQLENKDKEISQNCKQLESLKEELLTKTGEAQRGMEVNKKLTMKVNDLKLEIDALCEHENELEEQLRNKAQENLLLRNEKEGMDAKVVELERSLAEMGNEVSALQDKLKAEKDTYTKSTSLMKTRVFNLQEEVESLNAQRRKLELRNEFERRESPRKAMFLENKGFQLTNRTAADQSGLSSDQEDSTSRSSRRRRINKQLSPELDLQLVERKMEEYTEEYRMKIEDNMRILGQRILVIEQLHLETRESYNLNRESFHQGSRMLKECTIAHKSDLKKLKDASIAANDALIWLDLVIRTFEERSNKILSRVSNAMDVLQFMKSQVSNCNSGNRMSCQKIDRNEDLEVIKENNQDLSARLEKEVKEKLHLVKAGGQLEKKVLDLEKLVRERDQGILSVGEEKREAIRQLCILVDYHRGRCDQYREVIVKITGRRRTN